MFLKNCQTLNINMQWNDSMYYCKHSIFAPFLKLTFSMRFNKEYLIMSQLKHSNYSQDEYMESIIYIQLSEMEEKYARF